MAIAWNTTSELTHWWQNHSIDKHSNHCVDPPSCNVDRLWASDEVGLPKLEWGNMPLTPDKQAWQEVDKILEIVGFVFAQNLSPAEKEAFEHRVYALTK